MRVYSLLKYGCLLIAVLVVLKVSAQRKEPYEMMVSGVKVIVQPSNNEIVEIQTIIRGGVQNYSLARAGIESLAMAALTECGTANDTKNSFKNKLDKVSAQVHGIAGADFAQITMNCIKSDFETVWPLYADAITTPAFDKKEFERIRQNAVNVLKAQASSPDYAIQKLARETAFAGKDYAKMPEGTEASVTRLAAEETRAYYKSILVKSRMLIVVVAELSKEDIRKKVEALMADIPSGNAFNLKKESYIAKQNSFISQKKDLATNYLQAISGAPSPGSPDYNAFTLAMRIFYDRQFLEVRTNNGLSYAPGSYFSGGATASSNIVVSTTDPNKYIDVMNKLLLKTKNEGFKEEEVRNKKTTYLTLFFFNQETNSAQASSLAANEVLHNNWRRSLTLVEDFTKLTPADLQKAFNKYVSNFTWVYQGDPTKVNPVLYTGKPKSGLPDSKMTNKKN
jgi:zinc protease